MATRSPHRTKAASQAALKHSGPVGGVILPGMKLIPNIRFGGKARATVGKVILPSRLQRKGRIPKNFLDPKPITPTIKPLRGE